GNRASAAALCPPSPSVASTSTAPGPATAGASSVRQRSRSTGTCAGAGWVTDVPQAPVTTRTTAATRTTRPTVAATESANANTVPAGSSGPPNASHSYQAPSDGGVSMAASWSPTVPVTTTPVSATA